MNTVPTGAAADAARDAYYVYRPMLDLIGTTEGTDKGRGYNETLAYGAYTGGDVNLVGMSLSQIDALQTKMLANPKNKLNSSAVGRYQIVRTTLRSIRKTLALMSAMKFDAGMQDRCACFLLGQRGIDKYLSGRLSENTLINNLAHEWASLPTPSGKGAYGGQNAAVSVDRVRSVLAVVKARHMAGQPKREVKVPVEVDKPVVPETVDQTVRKHTRGWGWSGILSGSIGTTVTAALGDWRIVALFVGLAIAGGIVAFIAGPMIIRRFKTIRAEVEA